MYGNWRIGCTINGTFFSYLLIYEICTICNNCRGELVNNTRDNCIMTWHRNKEPWSCRTYFYVSVVRSIDGLFITVGGNLWSRPGRFVESIFVRLINSTTESTSRLSVDRRVLKYRTDKRRISERKVVFIRNARRARLET